MAIRLELDGGKVTVLDYLVGILESNPRIGAVSAAWYVPIKHGTTPKNWNLFRRRGEALDELRRGTWLHNGRIGVGVDGERYILGLDELMAVGLIFLGWSNEEKKEDLALGMPLLDLECRVDKLNLMRMSTALQRYSGDWSLFVGDESYHLYVNALVPLTHLPWHYGDILERLSAVEPFLHGRRTLLGLGESLKRDGFDLNRVKRMCFDILENVGHIGDVMGKRALSAVDLRHLAHTLLQTVDFIEGGCPNLGVLRISPMFKGGPVPSRVAYKEGNDVVVCDLFDRAEKLGQLRLAGM